MVELRTGRPDEGMRLLELSASVGWNHSPAECDFMLSAPSSEIVFALEAGEIAGCAGIFRYGADESGFINLVIVRPQFRRRGLATRMIGYMLEKYRHIPNLRLHATPEGSMVYSQLGFRPLRRLGLYTAERPSLPAAGLVRRLRPEELPAAAAADREVFGFDRLNLLAANYRVNPEASLTAIHDDGKPRSFVHGRRGRIMRQISALSADSAAEALTLVAAETSLAPEEKASIVVYDFQREFQEMLAAAGFSRVRDMIEMDYGVPGRIPSPRCFAVWGGDLG